MKEPLTWLVLCCIGLLLSIGLCGITASLPKLGGLASAGSLLFGLSGIGALTSLLLLIRRLPPK